jgi:hypothetical protein
MLVVDEGDVRRNSRRNTLGDVVVELVVEGDGLLERAVTPTDADRDYEKQ